MTHLRGFYGDWIEEFGMNYNVDTKEWMLWYLENREKIYLDFILLDKNIDQFELENYPVPLKSLQIIQEYMLFFLLHDNNPSFVLNEKLQIVRYNYKEIISE
ncbi:hypothetical protein FDH34_gp454 [Serratia phage BF]|uniref:Uncharacterized protein n=1 Tax=Serratia phage BF TaxID=1962671 RepID=A0A1S6UB98_9CAUD|nr:hypothetical protein FDH34_gp454 [Serratia phage BF]AQW88991.1 hypothetical protein BF_0466 [Serratia phage BF]